MSTGPGHRTSTSTTTDHRKDENIEQDEKSEKDQEKLFVPVKGKGRNKIMVQKHLNC